MNSTVFAAMDCWPVRTCLAAGGAVAAALPAVVAAGAPAPPACAVLVAGADALPPAGAGVLAAPVPPPPGNLPAPLRPIGGPKGQACEHLCRSLLSHQRLGARPTPQPDASPL